MNKCDPCQIFTKKMRVHPAPLHTVITIGPFAKWAVDFMTCNLVSAKGHRYIIVATEYFTRWAKAVPTTSNDSETATYFMFNNITARFKILKEITSDHGTHF